MVVRTTVMTTVLDTIENVDDQTRLGGGCNVSVVKKTKKCPKE